MPAIRWVIPLIFLVSWRQVACSACTFPPIRQVGRISSRLTFARRRRRVLRSGKAMLTAAQAGEILGMSARAVYELAATGRLAHYRYPIRMVRFDEADVMAFKESCRREIEPPRRSNLTVTSTRLRVSDPEGKSPLIEYFESQGYTYDGVNLHSPGRRKKGK